MPATPEHPYPKLKIRPSSGLSFPWCEYHPGGSMGSFDAHLGCEGVSLIMLMLVYWEDLDDAIQELLGYSFRDATTIPTAGVATLRRNLPWQHPFYNQLWVKNISSIKGMRLEGTDFPSVPLGGAGPGYSPNSGPWTKYNLAVLTIHFWRPPYAVRSDGDIIDEDGNPQEWLRYVDKNWELSVQLLSKENQSYTWVKQQGPINANSTDFQGSVGQKFCKMKVKRTWYQIPEAAIFTANQDATPAGLPQNLLYTQTQTRNPITGFTYDVGLPIVGCVNAPIGGGPLHDTPPYVTDENEDLRFFGCKMGTLLLEGIEFTPQALQLPAFLMDIPPFGPGLSEAISQVQYNITFHFEWCDPPAFRLFDGFGDDIFPGSVPSDWAGYNLAPYSGNGLWYAIQTKKGKDGVSPPSYPGNPAVTQFHYADFSDCFQIL